MIKNLLLTALGFWAVTAQAGWTIVGNPTVQTAQGATGSYTFTISGDASLNAGTYNLGPLTATPDTIPNVTITGTSLSASSVTLINVPYSFFIPPSGPTITGAIDGVAVADFTATVDWSVPRTLPPGSYDIAVTLGYTPETVGASTAGTDAVGGIIILVPSPEPAQTLSAFMLVGCGGVMFAGRRLFKKQTA